LPVLEPVVIHVPEAQSCPVVRTAPEHDADRRLAREVDGQAAGRRTHVVRGFVIHADVFSVFRVRFAVALLDNE
jgi:hypothetical protein